MKKKLLFIANPISGARSGIDFREVIDQCLDAGRFQWSLYLTTGRGDATLRAKKAIEEGIRYVVAIGGDGTINEVAQALVGSKVAMGIIPNGSGNGLAYHLGISDSIPEALAQLQHAEEWVVDTGRFNGQLFLNVAGIGFDAQVAHAFDRYGKRGLFSYIKLSVREFLHFSPPICSIRLDEEEKERRAFIITIANGSQYGNHAYIAPRAKLNDGLLDVVIVKPLKFWQLLTFSLKLFTRTLRDSSSYELVQAKKIEIRASLSKAQIDGEAVEAKTENIIEIVPRSLTVLAPPH